MMTGSEAWELSGNNVLRARWLRRLLARAWQRVPVIARAAITGSLLSLLGSTPCAIVLAMNLKVFPSVPWSAPLVTAYLWLYWRYLNGWGWPRSTAEARRRNLRANSLSPRVWRWSLWAGGLAIATMSAVGQVARRFVEPARPWWFSDVLSATPSLTLVCLLLMGSVVAGIVEEAAFRGYMQVPIERRHGPMVGIAVVAVLFTLAHFSTFPNMSLPLFAGLLAISFGYGILAYLSGSILPGLVLHATGDAVGLLAGWWLRGRIRVPRFSETGPDLFFWIDCLAVLVLSVLTVWAYRRLARVASSERRRVE